MKGILQGIEYMHKKSIIHRDLKPGIIHTITGTSLFLENMLLRTKKDLSSMTLIDFGLGKKKKDSKIVRSKMGTTVYMAPELLNSKGYSFVLSTNSPNRIILYSQLTSEVAGLSCTIS